MLTIIISCLVCFFVCFFCFWTRLCCFYHLQVNMFAPNIDQMHVVDHLKGAPSQEKRNVLVESARLARGNIQDLSKLSVKEHEAVIFPGLCSYVFRWYNRSLQKKDVGKVWVRSKLKFVFLAYVHPDINHTSSSFLVFYRRLWSCEESLYVGSAGQGLLCKWRGQGCSAGVPQRRQTHRPLLHLTCAGCQSDPWVRGHRRHRKGRQVRNATWTSLFAF